MPEPSTSVEASPEENSPSHLFTATPRSIRRRRIETIAKWVTLAMALILVIPVVGILGFIFKEAWPVLSLEYLWGNPENGSREGGIWAPLIGTFYLVFVSLLIVA